MVYRMEHWNGLLMTYVCHMVRHVLFLKEHLSLPHNISKSTVLRNVVVRQCSNSNSATWSSKVTKNSRLIMHEMIISSRVRVGRGCMGSCPSHFCAWGQQLTHYTDQFSST